MTKPEGDPTEHGLVFHFDNGQILTIPGEDIGSFGQFEDLPGLEHFESAEQGWDINMAHVLYVSPLEGPRVDQDSTP